jgi:hypothetical protein
MQETMNLRPDRSSQCLDPGRDVLVPGGAGEPVAVLAAGELVRGDASGDAFSLPVGEVEAEPVGQGDVTRVLTRYDLRTEPGPGASAETIRLLKPRPR